MWCGWGTPITIDGTDGSDQPGKEDAGPEPGFTEGTPQLACLGHSQEGVALALDLAEANGDQG